MPGAMESINKPVSFKLKLHELYWWKDLLGQNETYLFNEENVCTEYLGTLFCKVPTRINTYTVHTHI